MKIIFLDLDKTLIGEDYSPEPAKKIVEFLKEREFKIIFNSSKTKAEQEYYRKALDISDPFIVETGSAVYIPKDDLPFNFPFTRKERNYLVIELGVNYTIIKKALDEIRDEFGLKYYGNSSLEEVIKYTNLPRDLAKLAMQREYSETIFTWDTPSFEKELTKRELKISKGSRFYNVTGNTDKGKAAKLILNLYSQIEKVESYAVGDGQNDIPMLKVVDYPFTIGLSYSGAKNIREITKLMEVIK